VVFCAEDAEQEGFRLAGKEEYQNVVRFSGETLIDYLVTQSNVIAAVEGGKEPIEEVSRWLVEKIKPLFGDTAEGTFWFHGPIWYLQRAG
jgi:hypothetical protein